MKYIVIIVILLLLLPFSGCLDENPITEKTLNGKWKVIEKQKGEITDEYTIYIIQVGNQTRFIKGLKELGHGRVNMNAVVINSEEKTRWHGFGQFEVNITEYNKLNGETNNNIQIDMIRLVN